MTEIDDIELANRIRQNVMNILDLWSSKEEQLKYQKNVPIAQVSAELFCQWADDFYHPESTQFKMAFDEKERELLSDFDKTLNDISDKTTNDLPYFDDFVKTKEWKVVNRAAIKTLEKIKNTAANNGYK
ncbi:hypothetical protein M3P19_04110 [Muricauda sp. 2012CJ35-5]|uniref:Uncharacterized protein n=1 Tax=Flagellimonas spongiicola TaxID=2942208 RepID=A0ABT0PRT9_9FLAO|nr:hypothetical protein [Allomuricauda spongiicola]MCL6273178.1 hypothetical protein [Allomuricauda spongiicola]